MKSGRGRGRAPRRGAPRLALACALAASGGSEALAQEPPDPLPEVVRPVDPVVTRAVRPGELREDPSSFTTVIETEDFQGEAKDVADLVDRSVGVQVRRFGGPGARSEVQIRGSTPTQVVVLLDGVRLNTAQTGAVDLSTVPLDVLERVEVVRGGAATQAGSDAIGGVINLVTKRAGGERRTRLVGGAESFDTWQGSIFHSGSLGSLEYAASYAGFKTDGDWRFRRPEVEVNGTRFQFQPRELDRINNDSESHAAMLKLGHGLGENAHLEFTDNFYRVSRGQPGLDSGPGEVGGQRRDARERLLRNLAMMKLDAVELPFGFDAELRAYHRFERVRFRDPQPQGIFDSTTLESSNRNITLGGRGLLERSVRMLGARHDGSFALDWRRDSLRSNEYDDRNRNTWHLFLQDEISIWERRLRLVPALGMDDTEGYDTEWLPRIGGILEPWPWLRIKGNLERAYRAPNFDELYFPDKGFIRGNPNLDPEESVNWDAGLELFLDRLGFIDDVSLEAAWFVQDIDDSIVFVLVSPTTIAPVNTGSADVDGVEAALSLRLFDWIGASANHTWLRESELSNGTPLPGRSENQTNVRVEIGPRSGLFKLVGEMKWTDDIPAAFERRAEISDRTTWDAALLVDLAQIGPLRSRLPVDQLLVSFGGRNLTDQSVRDAVFFPQPGRVLYLRTEVAF